VKRVSDATAWPVDLIPAEEGGFIVNFPDLPNGWSQGETRDEALARAEDLLDEMILGKWRTTRTSSSRRRRKDARSLLCRP
jgi:hypothetical protein